MHNITSCKMPYKIAENKEIHTFINSIVISSDDILFEHSKIILPPIVKITKNTATVDKNTTTVDKNTTTINTNTATFDKNTTVDKTKTLNKSSSTKNIRRLAPKKMSGKSINGSLIRHRTKKELHLKPSINITSNLPDTNSIKKSVSLADSIPKLDIITQLNNNSVRSRSQSVFTSSIIDVPSFDNSIESLEVSQVSTDYVDCADSTECTDSTDSAGVLEVYTKLKKHNYESWNTNDLCRWLDEIGMSQYKHIFKSQQITGFCLSEITIENIKTELGITVYGHRCALYKHIQLLIKHNVPKTTKNNSSKKSTSFET